MLKVGKKKEMSKTVVDAAVTSEEWKVCPAWSDEFRSHFEGVSTT